MSNTQIVVVLDRSGSMHRIREDMEGGYNTFIADQAKTDPSATVSLHQFDDEYETCYTNTPITEVPQLSLVPRGRTALHDAIGRAITSTKEGHKNLPAASVPQVVFVIITDGEENYSSEYSQTDIKKAIESSTKKGWKFYFLGANQDAITVAEGIGISRDTSLTYNTGKVGETMGALSRSVTRGTVTGGYTFTGKDRSDAS